MRSVLWKSGSLHSAESNLNPLWMRMFHFTAHDWQLMFLMCCCSCRSCFGEVSGGKDSIIDNYPMINIRHHCINHKCLAKWERDVCSYAINPALTVSLGTSNNSAHKSRFQMGMCVKRTANGAIPLDQGLLQIDLQWPLDSN